MDAEDRTIACYQHCCLRHVNKEPMNNASLRERFCIEKHNKAQASNVIRDAIKAGVIRAYDPSVGPKSRRYVPFWA